MPRKFTSFAVRSAAITIFIYAFAVFVSFRPDITDWPAQVRFIAATFWSVAHLWLVVSSFGGKDADHG